MLLGAKEREGLGARAIVFETNGKRKHSGVLYILLFCFVFYKKNRFPIPDLPR